MPYEARSVASFESSYVPATRGSKTEFDSNELLERLRLTGVVPAAQGLAMPVTGSIVRCDCARFAEATQNSLLRALNQNWRAGTQPASFTLRRETASTRGPGHTT